MSTYQERQSYRDAHPGAIVDNNSSSDGGFHSNTPDGTPSGGGGGGNGGGGGGSVAANNNGATNDQLGAIKQAILDAIGSGNKAAADQAAAQFAQTFGLDTQKFQESIRQYNQNFTLAQAGITGTYNGAPTEAAIDDANKTALGVLTLTAGLHSDPFRQLSTMYAAHGMDGIRNAVNGLTGQYGLSGVFQAPGAAGNTATLGGIGSAFNNSPATQAQATSMLSTFPSANQVIARNYNQAPQNVKDFMTSGLSANNGLDQSANDKLIQNTLPKFTSPDFGLATV